jgi:hypothetical protein
MTAEAPIVSADPIEDFTSPLRDLKGILEQQHRWLSQLQEFSRKPILIKAKEGKIPPEVKGNEIFLYTWSYFKDIWSMLTEPIYTRRILDREILIDPDTDNWQTLTRELKKILTFFNREKIPYYLSYTGGKSFHMSVYLANVMLDTDIMAVAKRYDVDIMQVIRETLVDIIFKEAQARKEELGLDTTKISFSKRRRGSMVREYGTIRSDGHYKTLIDTIPMSKGTAGRLPLKFPEKVLLWDFSKYVPEIEIALKTACEVAQKNEEYSHEGISFVDTDLKKFPCIKSLIDKGRKVGRYYGTQSIALVARDCGYAWGKTEDILRKYLKNCGGLTQQEIDLRVHNVRPMFDTKEYPFSCRVLKMKFGKEYCNFNACPLKKKLKKDGSCSMPDINEEMLKKQEEAPEIKARALDILRNGKPVDFLINVFNTMHVSDQSAGKVLLCSIGSTCDLTSAGIHPQLTGNSGKGKSHAAKTVLHMVPKDWKLDASISPKYLFYEKIKPGTIFYTDDAAPNPEMESTIKRATTSFQTGAEHRSLDKNNNPHKGKIPPLCAWWLSSVDNDGSDQLINRQMDLEVDESPTTDEKVAEHQRKLAQLGMPEFLENPDVWCARQIIAEIKKNTFRVAIPFADKIVWADVKNRRNQPIFLDMVKAFTVFHFMQRERTPDGRLLATVDDFVEAKKVYLSRADTQTSKLSRAEINILSAMTEMQQKGIEVTIREIQERLNITRQRVQQLLTGKDGKSGLMAKYPGLSVQKISMPLRDENMDVIGHKQCAVFHVTGFNPWNDYTELVYLKNTEP